VDIGELNIAASSNINEKLRTLLTSQEEISFPNLLENRNMDATDVADDKSQSTILPAKYA